MKKNIKRVPINKKGLSSHDKSNNKTHHKAKDTSKSSPRKVSKKHSSGFFYFAIATLIIFSSFFYLYQEHDFDPVSSIRELMRDKGPVAATVNGQRIYFSEVEEYFTRIPDYMQGEITKQVVLDQIISQEVLVQEASRLGVTVTRQELDDFVDNAIADSGWTPEQFNQVLSAQGMTMNDLKDMYRVSLVIEKLIEQEVISKIDVTEEDVEEYYTNNINSFALDSDQVRAAHILIMASEDRDYESAYEIALNLSNRAKSGENFTELVMQYSEDPSIVQNQGDLGFFSREMMVSDFSDAVFEMVIGEISEPVRTDWGYHVIRLIDRRDAGFVVPLEEVFSDLRQNLLMQEQQIGVERYIRQLRDDSNIVYFDIEDVEMNETLDLEDVTDIDLVLDDLVDEVADDEVVVDETDDYVSDDEVVDDEVIVDETDDYVSDDEAVEHNVVVFEFNADGFNFVKDGEYNPEVRVSEGDLVRIEFTNDDAMPHDWVIDEFSARTEILSTGEFEYIEFVADQVGEFEYYCSVGSHRANGMFGAFIVE